MASAQISYGIGVQNRYAAFLDEVTDEGLYQLAISDRHQNQHHHHQQPAVKHPIHNRAHTQQQQPNKNRKHVTNETKDTKTALNDVNKPIGQNKINNGNDSSRRLARKPTDNFKKITQSNGNVNSHDGAQHREKETNKSQSSVLNAQRQAHGKQGTTPPKSIATANSGSQQQQAASNGQRQQNDPKNPRGNEKFGRNRSFFGKAKPSRAPGDNHGKREFDRRTASKYKTNEKRNGGGAHNWGKPEDDGSTKTVPPSGTENNTTTENAPNRPSFRRPGGGRGRGQGPRGPRSGPRSEDHKHNSDQQQLKSIPNFSDAQDFPSLAP